MALHHVSPGEKVNLDELRSGANRRATALVKTDAFEAAQLVLRAGEEISPHSVPGYAIVHCLGGRVVLRAAANVELGAGDWVYLQRGEEHSVHAFEDSVLLLTILFG